MQQIMHARQTQRRRAIPTQAAAGMTQLGMGLTGGIVVPGWGGVGSDLMHVFKTGVWCGVVCVSRAEHTLAMNPEQLLKFPKALHSQGTCMEASEAGTHVRPEGQGRFTALQS